MPTPTTPSVTGLIRYTRRSEKIWLPAWLDKNGVGISNSAKQLPIKPYYHCYAIATYDIYQVKALSHADYYTQFDALNNGTWNSWPQYCAWISEIETDGSRDIGDATSVEEIHYVVRCIKKTNGWRFEHPDVGYIFLDGATYKNFQDEEGEPPIGKLNGSGAKLGMATNLVVSTADIKQEVNFSTLFAGM